jgi:hypothetical protein
MPKTKKLTLKQVRAMAAKVRKECSEEFRFEIKVTRGNLSVLRGFFKDSHAKARGKFPKLVGDLTDELLIQYAIYHIVGLGIKKLLKEVGKKQIK